MAERGVIALLTRDEAIFGVADRAKPTIPRAYPASPDRQARARVVTERLRVGVVAGPEECLYSRTASTMKATENGERNLCIGEVSNTDERFPDMPDGEGMMDVDVASGLEDVVVGRTALAQSGRNWTFTPAPVAVNPDCS